MNTNSETDPLRVLGILALIELTGYESSHSRKQILGGKGIILRWGFSEQADGVYDSTCPRKYVHTETAVILG